MGYEIERKFLIRDNHFIENLKDGKKIRQGYISLDPAKIVRVRTKGDKAFLTLKAQEEGISRLEFEYEIPYGDALEMLQTMCVKPLIEKTRYAYSQGNHVWEIDVFEGDFAGTVVAEIELSEAAEEFEKPYWLGAEVTELPDYYNAEMVKRRMGSNR